MRRLRRIPIAWVPAILLCGCMTLHGGQRGKVVTESTYSAVPNLDVYLLVIKESRWLWQDSGRKSIARVDVGRTSNYGDFKFNRKPVWHWPLAQRVTEEEIIVNLSLRSDMLMRSLNDAAYVDFWSDPQYADPIDSRFLGMIITQTRQGAAASPQEKPKVDEIVRNEFVRMSAHSANLGNLEIPRRRNVGP